MPPAGPWGRRCPLTGSQPFELLLDVVDFLP